MASTRMLIIYTWHNASVSDLIHRVAPIVDRSLKHATILSDKSAWNNHVHSPLIEMLFPSPSPTLMDFQSCTTSSMDSTYHRFAEAASRVDYCPAGLLRRC
ncbi:uncharacterized protein BKA55DRAFT_581980 [Fusarium redolens]|uniref:PD-(D/E)XK nuclease-like domain-containing protein n=1 Tax=Fusarium redolens TaxID=48865 RepID=A0A9P9G336_FUSRE|nr:uncharacterized protein BKA55DRAFT_581980 [Fusarium redolens]KAH7231215.1 hypothetical protein BKA55DRAFT_581980 [Fusarium redolens]